MGLEGGWSRGEVIILVLVGNRRVGGVRGVEWESNFILVMLRRY